MGGEGSGPPVLLLHGVLGSARNWQRAGQLLAMGWRVSALDLRNHGGSPHHPRMGYPAMAGDVLSWMDTHSHGRVHLVGHSMGGKVAMYLACRYPERVVSLTVVDIAPRAYPPRWKREFELMQRMPVSQFSRRLEAEEWLEKDITDWAFRKFLVSNLERNPEGGFSWIVNLDTLHSALPSLFVQVPEDGWRYDGPVLYLRGGRSRFVEDSDEPMIRRFFPFARLQTIADAGHNVHFDQPEAFLEAVSDHLRRTDR